MLLRTPQERLLILHQILYSPFNSVSKPLQLVNSNLTTSILSSVAKYKKEDDAIVLDDDVYYCLLVESLDSGDTRTTEEDNEIQPEDDTPQVSTRSGRRSAREKNSNFAFY